MNYDEYVKSKSKLQQWDGIQSSFIPKGAFDYQEAIIKWSLSKGRSAIFADCGLGKTLMQLSWARSVCDATQKPVLITAPLSVVEQTKEEAKDKGINFDGIEIINYERLHRIDTDKYSGVVLDESSILKNFSGTMRNNIIDRFINTPYKLACTATPSPNDFMELGNHAEFLGVMSYTEMLATYFIHDGGDTSKWRLKGHGVTKFWEWLCTWAMFIKNPSDLGFDGFKHKLPPLQEHKHCIEDDFVAMDTLIPLPVQGLSERNKVRKQTIDIRMSKVKEIVDNTEGQIILWVDLNNEADELRKIIPEAVEIRGNDEDTEKARKISEFAHGKIKVLITKQDITGFGVNWQQCSNMIFCSINDSYEALYQAIRRCWRYGQKNPVNVHYIYTERQQSIIENLARKSKLIEEMEQRMVEATSTYAISELHGGKTQKTEYAEAVVTGDGFTAHLGDCVKITDKMPDESVDYSIFSPPFASLYTYSNSDYDMGNCKNDDDFANQFKYMVRNLYRILRTGRLVSFHCMNLPATIQNDGFIGIKDFRGDLIRMFEAEGFIYHSEVVIWKDPVTAMQRTKALGLLHKQIKKDSCMSRQGIPDYLVTMRKKGKNTKPVENTNESFPVQLWQQYASPVWMDINPSDTLQFREARESDDERHICPLQLQVIERAIKLWSTEGDTVFSPFMGIGSEGYVSLKMNRNFIGTELKKSYFDLAVRNLESAKNQYSLAI